MNAKIRRKFNMFECVHRYALEYLLMNAGAVALAAFNQLEISLGKLRAAAAGQASARGESAGGVSWREDCWRELRRRLVDVNRTARVLGDVSVRPTFRLPRTRSYPALITAAKVIVAEARAMEEDFLNAGMRAGFLEEIEQLLADFETATNQKIDGKLAQAEATSGLERHARLALNAATTLDACARNYFRDNPAALGAWIVARHIERSPRRASEPQGQGEPAKFQQLSADKVPSSNHGNGVPDGVAAALIPPGALRGSGVGPK